MIWKNLIEFLSPTFITRGSVKLRREKNPVASIIGNKKTSETLSDIFVASVTAKCQVPKYFSFSD